MAFPVVNPVYGNPDLITGKSSQTIPTSPIEEPVVETIVDPNKDKKQQPKNIIPPNIEDKVDKIVSTTIPGTNGSNGTSFNYDSSQDPEYKRQAANLENQIVQSMVGRGGLYSSVTQQEVQTTKYKLKTVENRQ